MRIFGLILLVIIGMLQYRLWFGKNSIADYRQRQLVVERQLAENHKLKQRNQLLYADIDDLKIGLEAVEERARNELGMIRKGETFYRIVPKKKKAHAKQYEQ